MITISIEEIQRDLRGYLHRVEAGETITVTDAEHPVAEIKPAAPDAKPLRPFGLYAGEFVVPDDFDAPMALVTVTTDAGEVFDITDPPIQGKSHERNPNT
jgi:antitoxin (DNA-binding transcriptional repressor) of toxin-antitoxin stability system